jgi:hypothetical protein
MTTTATMVTIAYITGIPTIAPIALESLSLHPPLPIVLLSVTIVKSQSLRFQALHILLSAVVARKAISAAMLAEFYDDEFKVLTLLSWGCHLKVINTNSGCQEKRIKSEAGYVLKSVHT